jgi:hypothetical protein|tara:strand:- start:173 stop:424 length:252 start_codon:yes stop_codon:yes gene_type:complete
MKKVLLVLGLSLALLSCSVEELPCNDWVTNFKTEINILNDGSEQIYRMACRGTECVMITEEDYQLWIDISLATTCWQDAENSI